MTITEAWMWTWIYLGMVVGVMTWIIVVATVFLELKNKDKK